MIFKVQNFTQLRTWVSHLSFLGKVKKLIFLYNRYENENSDFTLVVTQLQQLYLGATTTSMISSSNKVRVQERRLTSFFEVSETKLLSELFIESKDLKDIFEETIRKLGFKNSCNSYFDLCNRKKWFKI